MPGVSPGVANLHGRVPRQEAPEQLPFRAWRAQVRRRQRCTLRRDAVAAPSMPYTYTYTEVLQVLGNAVIFRLNARTFELGVG